ncbi:hypothetical protein VPNG_01287 [Cytospora leucostoma]|uniref:Uncharacterized protein n=1 Tax=Cytospora leucostoma TaxID=1230097 RepID=A0A423XLN1_9PEZI|nr:hypothetical protein VPNG_01287 [Cytospora leucostoma]
MAPDVRRVSFREDNKSRSASSRSSTLKSESGVGSTSTGSSYSGTHYSDRYGPDPLYEVNALKQALKDSVEDVDLWKRKAEDIEKKLRKELGEAKSRVEALEAHCNLLEDDKKRVQREKTAYSAEVKSLTALVSSLKGEKDELKQDNDKLKQEKEKPMKKTEKQPVSASSLEVGKPHRSGSKLSRDSDSDKEKDRLSKRFEPRNENSSETSSAKQSSSKAPRSRRMSNAYVEPYGQGAPRSTGANPLPHIANGTRYIATSKTDYPATSQYQDPAYSSTPRSTGLERPTVLYQYPDVLAPNLHYEDGYYSSHPVRR